MAAKLKDSAELFAALGDETRLQIVATLSEKGPRSISRLTEGKKITRQAVTKHLEVLQQAGLADCHQEGREKIWDLNEKRLQVATEFLEHVSKRWEERLGRLKELVEK